MPVILTRLLLFSIYHSRDIRRTETLLSSARYLKVHYKLHTKSASQFRFALKQPARVGN